MDALTLVTALAVLLFIGVISSWIASKLHLPDVLLLIITGMIFGNIRYEGGPILEFPELLLTSLAILALAMIIFDSTARLRIKEFDTFSMRALRLAGISTIVTIIIFSAATALIAKLPIWLSILFATIVSGTSPDILLPSLKHPKHAAIKILKLESLFNTPLTVLLPFIVIDLMQGTKTSIIAGIIEQLVPFVMKFIVGLGAGVFIGLVLFKLIQKAYTEVYSPLAVIIAALLAYVLAENLGGSGVISVTALGLFFGNVYVKEKPTLLTIEGVITKALYVIVFILIGLIIKIPYEKQFFITAGSLLIVYYTIRYLAVVVSFNKQSAHEKIYMTLNAPKGIAAAAVVFILAITNLQGMGKVLDLTLTFILASIIISSITTWATPRFLHENRS